MTVEPNTPSLSEPYFEQLSSALQQHGTEHPALIIDLDRLDHNLALVKDHLSKSGLDIRLVVKSLPSKGLIDYCLSALGTQKLMCFHIPYLKQVSIDYPNSDILIGKPFTVGGLEHYFDWMSRQTNEVTFQPEHQIQWLVDSLDRLSGYDALANRLGLTLRINLEVDIGLHRGGFQDINTFLQALAAIQASPNLSFTGIMGYEAHISKCPSIPIARMDPQSQATARYTEFLNAIVSTRNRLRHIDTEYRRQHHLPPLHPFEYASQ